MSLVRKRQRRINKLAEEMFNESTSSDNGNEFGDMDSSASDNESNPLEVNRCDSPLQEPVLSDLDEESDFNEFDYVSSEDEFEDDIRMQLENNLRSDLAAWTTKINLPRDATNELLGILRNYGNDVPKDSRTLKATPRDVDVLSKCGGSYFYFGIRNGISSALEQFVEQGPSVKLSVNVDGLPLDKSTNSQLWPILGSVNSSDYVFVIAIFHGYSKPNSVEEYLFDFIKEATDILKNGLTLNDRNYQFSIKCFICDAPARSFLKCIIGHGGYHACERCIIPGERVESRTVYNKATYKEKLRKGAKFEKGEYLPDHQKDLSPLIEIGIDCVSQFPLDYMHLVCLGVVKRVLMYIIKGPHLCKLSQNLIGQISARLCLHNGKMPSEFNRQPRPLSDLCHWKSTEFRQFILYHGPLVLRGIVNPNFYEHFLLFHVAISLLLKSSVSVDDANDARRLLQKFVKTSKTYYGSTFNVYNVHSLPHIVDDALKYGSLNEISAFKFENFMQELKKRVRSSQNPVAQVVKRMSERSTAGSNIKPSKKCRTNLKANGKNSFFFNVNGDLCITQHVGPNYLDCKVISTRQMEPFYRQPVDSRRLGIYFTKNLLNLDSERQLIAHEDVIKKAVQLPYKDGFVFLPLLHFFGENKY